MLIQRRYSRVFDVMLKQTTLSLILWSLYHFLKFFIASYFLTTPLTEWSWWLILMMVHSAIGFVYNLRMLQLLGQNVLTISIAQSLNHTIDFIELQSSPQEPNQRIEDLIDLPYEANLHPYSISQQLVLRFWDLQILCKLTYCGYHILLLWGLRIQFKESHFIILIFVFITLYQNSSLYLTLACLVLITLPVLFCMFVFKKIREPFKRYKIHSTINRLQTRKTQIEDIQYQCQICLDHYLLNEELVVLPCDVRHFFHKHCAKEWLLTRHTCPMCRSDIRL